MRMTRGTIQGLGIAGGLTGAALLAWGLAPSISRSLSGVTPLTLDFQPQQPAATQPFAAIVAARGQSGAQLAAQGAVVANGQVGAHFWSSNATAESASQQYWSVYNQTVGTSAQKAAAAEASVAALSTEPSARLALGTAGSNGTAQLTLYSEALNPGTYTILAWVAKAGSSLLVPDAVGTPLASLERSSVPYIALQLVLA